MVNGCLPLCQPCWCPVQGVPHRAPKVNWDWLQLPRDMQWISGTENE